MGRPSSCRGCRSGRLRVLIEPACWPLAGVSGVPGLADAGVDPQGTEVSLDDPAQACRPTDKREFVG